MSRIRRGFIWVYLIGGCTLMTRHSYAQHSIRLGLDINHDVYSIWDTGNKLEKGNRINLSPAINYQYSVPNQKLVLGCGMAFKIYPTSLVFKELMGFIATGKIAVIMPTTIGLRLKVGQKQRFSFTPFTGLTSGVFLLPTSSNTSRGYFRNGKDTVVYFMKEKIVSSSFALFNVGVDVGIKLASRVSVAVAISGSFGLLTVMEDRVEYLYNRVPYSGGITSRGSFLSIAGVHLVYHFFK